MAIGKISAWRRKEMNQYMVCDKAGEALKQNRFSDATFDTKREAEAFRIQYASRQKSRSAEDYVIVEID
jgi:hypothetical protein